MKYSTRITIPDMHTCVLCVSNIMFMPYPDLHFIVRHYFIFNAVFLRRKVKYFRFIYLYKCRLKEEKNRDTNNE